MAFKRKVEMIAGTSSSGVVISGLDISFDITRNREFSNNTGKFKIYNPSEDTVGRVLKKGNSVTFKAGYEDEGMGLIYIGQITEAIPSRLPPNPFVEVTCGSVQSSNTALSSITVSLSYKKGTNLSRPINEISNSLGLSVSGLNNISGIQMSNGYALAGNVKDALRYVQNVLERNGCGLFIDNTTLVIFKKGEGYNRTAVYLSPSTGLLKSPKLIDNVVEDEKIETDYTQRAIFSSILNFNIVPNGYVKIDSKSVKGTYLVDKCNFKGDNFGGAFEVNGEGIGGPPRAGTTELSGQILRSVR